MVQEAGIFFHQKDERCCSVATGRLLLVRNAIISLRPSDAYTRQ